MSYTAPIKDMMFAIKELAGLEALAALPGREQFDADTAEAILQECGKFCSEVVAPLNQVGDKQPSYFENGKVTTAPGFKEAFQQFVQGGWQGLTHPETYGGQEAPKLISTATSEMLNAANLSFALAPLLTDGAIEALLTAASDTLKQKFIPNMISGQWTGTMNLTEPQAGSDLAAVRTHAEPQADGSYKLFGTKIYITYGEHDLAENIVHLVLARCPNAPAGVKGLSLFVAPKFLVNADGSLGARNDIHCISIEHKLGIKASPTAVLQFGDNDGAIGYLVGEENRGLEYMFIMMNAARFAVGIQGIALSDRAYQKAVGYARDRVQSKDLTGPESVAIIHHPDVKRMLMTMRAYTEGARALAYFSAAACDLSKSHPDAEVRKQMFAFYEFTVPIVKGFSTEMSIDVTSLGVQVHGGMGFIEETGAAQFYRDARILPIYEGTTAIQANDLIGRKTLRDGGATVAFILKEIATTEAQLATSNTSTAQSMRTQLQAGREALQQAVQFIAANAKTETKVVFAGSVTYLRLCGLVLCGWQMARALLAAQIKEQEDPEFYSAKIATARFYAEHLLSQAPGLSVAITQGGHSANALNENQF